jgi:integrase
MGMIYKRGKTYWIKYYRNGKPYRESTRSRKEADAKRLLKKREGEISRGKLPGIYFDRMTFDEVAEDFLADYRINRKKSLNRAEKSVEHLNGAFEGMRVTNITTDRIKAYVEARMAWKCKQCKETVSEHGIKEVEAPKCPHCGSKDILKQGAASGTINRELSALKRMLNLGAKHTPPKVDRVPYIPMLKENNVRKGFFEHDQFLAVRNALPFHLKGFVTLAYKTGWRIGEVSNLTWSKVDLKQGIVRLEPGESKNDEPRTVYLDDELKAMFIRQWNSRKDAQKVLPYIFLNETGTDRVKRFDKAWKTACKDAGVGIKLFHDLRRTAVRNMVRSGVPERVAMMVSGHKTRSVFDRYNVVNDTDLKLAAQKQEEYLKSQMGTVSGTTKEFDNTHQLVTH